jgi:hypothetical protein
MAHEMAVFTNSFPKIYIRNRAKFDIVGFDVPAGMDQSSARAQDSAKVIFKAAIT